MKRESERADRGPNDGEPIDARALELQRYADGALDQASRAIFEARLQREPSLRGELAGLLALRSAFAPEARSAGPLPSAGFRERVLARALVAAPAALDPTDEPVPAQDQPVPAQDEILGWARRALVAALLIAVLSLVALWARCGGRTAASWRLRRRTSTRR